MADYQTFTFVGFDWEEDSRQLSLHYRLGNLPLYERFVFDFPWGSDVDKDLLDRASEGLLVMAGISYYKTFLPSEIRFEYRSGLHPRQASFFERVYRQGLGEFYYQNGLIPPKTIGFPVDEEAVVPSVKPFTGQGNLVLLGGGKDSLTTVGILKHAGEDFETLTVNTDSKFIPQLERIGHSHRNVIRTIDPKLFTLNEEGAYNGHVPISSILAFTGVVAAILRGKSDVILSNEQSANIPNTVYHDMEINHQYSKSLDFERGFQHYMERFVSNDISYFSFLRPLSELRIGAIFAQYFWERFGDVFSSCNTNFKVGTRKGERSDMFTWCGQCPKCAFAFALFSAFLSREELVKTFGKNLFEDPSLSQTFQQLLGVEGIKPFECVGDHDEVRSALIMARDSGQWPTLKTWDIPAPREDWKAQGGHALPDHFATLLQNFLHESVQ